MFGQLVVRIDENHKGNLHHVTSGRYTVGKEMNVILVNDMSGILKVLIVDNFNDLQYLDIEKVKFVRYETFTDSGSAVTLSEAPKKKGTKQVTLEDNIKELGTNDTGAA